MRIFTKVDGKLVVYETDATWDNLSLAVEQVKQELGTAHKTPVLVLVKY
jgi:hypothetical protein